MASSSKKHAKASKPVEKPIAQVATANTDPVPPVEVRKGPKRPFLVTEPPSSLSKVRTLSDRKEILSLVFLLLVASYVRLRDLQWPNSIVFDEVHFGGFASKYIQGTFFFDVHPPLAKMLFAYVAQLGGFKGDFPFDNIGDEFPSTTPYVLMRLFAALSGLLTVLLMYFTLRASGVRSWICLMAALCFAVENSFVTISRYILLDAPLILFIAAAAYSFKRYELYPTGSLRSYRYLLATGISLGLAVSSKWVGLFTVAWIGSLCIWRLWFFIGDLSRPLSSTIKIAISKLTALLLVPATLYAIFFYLHFEILKNDGQGSSFFSSEFRSTLRGNTIPTNMQYEVGYGSVVTIRHTGTYGGYLHSHPLVYETGSKQQQVTLYSHLDPNNDWIIEPYNQSGVSLKSFHGLADGAKIRLLHSTTQHRLHSHDHPPPVSHHSDWQKEVSGYGYPGFKGDANDDWIIEIDKAKSKPGISQEYVMAVDTKFRLRHAMSGGYLFSHNTKLPKWASEQQEVTCANSGIAKLTLWYIEGNENPTLPLDTKRISYQKPSFWKKLIESHDRMWEINKNLVDTHYYQSYPDEWPFLKRGISYWGKYHRQVYLLGNPALWWSATVFIVVFALVVIYELLAWQLGSSILQDSHVVNFHVQVIHYLLGFAAHYIPSFLMKRQMFLHHYLPAYYFALLALAHAMDILVTYVLRRRQKVGYAVLVVFTALCCYMFYQRAPIVYGTPWTKKQCEQAKILGSWDFNCAEFMDDYDAYKTIPTTADPIPATESATDPLLESKAVENVQELL